MLPGVPMAQSTAGQRHGRRKSGGCPSITAEVEIESHSMSAHDRQRAIEHLLSQSGELHLTDLASRFQVSEMTIRRDLGTLEDRGVLRRVVGGGAIAIAQKTREPSFTTRALDESGSKTHIGAAVAGLLKAGEAIYLDGGSTCLAVARAIRGRDLGLTVVTRSLFAALELADEPGSQVILLGGRIKPGEMVTTRTGFDQDTGRYNVESYVMGISGADPARGLTDYDPEEAVTKRQAINCADRVILAVDKTKLGRVLLVKVAEIDDLDTVVTDAHREHPAIAAFADKADVVCIDAHAAPRDMRPAQ
jgi:DeoR/GlpR family transcriptional regulator of sugar metabolism